MSFECQRMSHHFLLFERYVDMYFVRPMDVTAVLCIILERCECRLYAIWTLNECFSCGHKNDRYKNDVY